MAAEFLTIEICSPTSEAIEFTADEVVIPGSEGVMTIMPGHTLLLSTLRSGVLIIQQEDKKTFFAVHGGFAEIAQDRIAILADQVEQGCDIDHARAELAKTRAEELLNKPTEGMSVEKTEAALSRALARLHAHGEEVY